MTDQIKDNKQDSAPSVWGIRRFYQQAWKLTIENKKLWLFGFAFLVFALSGQTYSSNNTSLENVELNEEVISQLDQNPQVIKFQQELSEGIAAVPAPVYGVLIAELVVFVGYVVGLLLVSSNWSKAALILAVSKAAVGRIGKLADISYLASRRIKPLLWLSLVPLLSAFVLMSVWLIIVALLTTLHPVIGVGLIVITILVAAYLFMRLGLSLMWAERLVVLDNLSGRAAFVLGWKLSKGNILKTIKLLVANAVVMGLVSFLVTISLTIVTAILGSNVEAGKNSILQTLLHFQITTNISTAVFMLVTAVQYVFLFATYHYAYVHLRQAHEKKGTLQ